MLSYRGSTHGRIRNFLLLELTKYPSNDKGVGEGGLSYVSREHRKSKRLLTYIMYLNKEVCNLTLIPLTVCFIQQWSDTGINLLISTRQSLPFKVYSCLRSKEISCHLISSISPYRVHKNHPFSPILSQFNPFCTFTVFLPQILSHLRPCPPNEISTRGFVN